MLMDSFKSHLHKAADFLFKKSTHKKYACSIRLTFLTLLGAVIKYYSSTVSCDTYLVSYLPFLSALETIFKQKPSPPMKSSNPSYAHSS